MERIKVAFIGAGSAAWSSRIIMDFLIHEDLRNRVDIWLMDINDARLDLIYNFSKRYISELGAEARVFKTKNRVEAIREADFVINSAMAGGHSYYERMRDVSERHGYYRGINSVEWNYVSDYHTIWGYYQFKLMMDIARDVETYAPNAWVINVANPVFELTTLITRLFRKIRFIGLCHGHLGFIKAVEVLGMRLAKEKLKRDITAQCAMHDPECYSVIAELIDFGDLEIEMSGFNHVIWLTKFMYAGENAYRYLDDWIREDAHRYWEIWSEYTTNPFDIDLSPAAIDMYRTYGSLPIGDTVRGGTWKYHWDLKTKQSWYGPYGGPDSEIGWAMYIAGLRRSLENLSSAVYDTTKPLVQRYPPEPSGESIIEIIDALVNNKSKKVYYIYLRGRGEKIKIPVPIQVNIPNEGVLSNIPNDVAVEIPVEISGGGIRRIPITQPPHKIYRYVLLHRLMRAEWALEAFLEGGRDSLIQWLAIDVRTKNMKQIEEVIDAILKIPENEEMAKHFS